VIQADVPERMSIKVGEHNLLLAVAPVADRNYVNLYECAPKGRSMLDEDAAKS
jgi:hypothetical protein